MKFALVNPRWDFFGSTYFGCRQPHFPLEFLFASAQLRSAGHDTWLVDAHMNDLSSEQVKSQLDRFRPDFLVVTTAPTYLFWRCPPPELRVPREWIRALDQDAITVVVGPHSSATPASALRKTGCTVALRGEPDQVLAALAAKPWREIAGCCFSTEDGLHISNSLAAANMRSLPAIDFSGYEVERHQHCHHVFTPHADLGAELEFARGCPWSCSFCNKTLFRNQFRERSVDAVLAEVDALIERGVGYVYFIDEVFGVGKNVGRLLEGLAQRKITIGLQTRIDLWNEETLELLGRAHCISMECGIESITEEGRAELNKKCRIDTGRIGDLLIFARSRIPWVQANLILSEKDDREQIRSWQEHLKARGVWVSEPVPMFPFPGSPLYAETFGAAPDDQAWERAHHYYTATFANKGYSDIQEQKPVPIEELENAYPDHR
jgi:anaerobic magnesium-protoporphyrin IX monomethyl ester cyclase